MSDIHHLPRLEDAEREASEWIARLQADDVSADDRIQFEAWLNAHPRHANAYADLMATWQQLAAAGRTVRAVSFGNAMEAATRKRRRRGKSILILAAALLTVGVVGGTWNLYRWRPQSEFQTGIGEHASVTLPDGSNLELNSNSAVLIAYGDGARVVELERGEAFFTVAHDTSRPFWVVADRTWVRAVGTAFNVYRRESGVRVTVSEGRVKVAEVPSGRERPSDKVLEQQPVSLLDAGQQADLGDDLAAQVRRLPLPDVEREVSWRSGRLYFEKRPLHEVVDELARYTPLRIELDAGVRDLPVDGAFQASPQGAEALLNMLHDGLGLSVRRENGQRVRVE